MKNRVIYIIVAAIFLASACIDRSYRVTGVRIDQNTVTINAGESMMLTATVIPANAHEQTIYWRSENPEIVNVENGRITALRGGETRIQVSTKESEFYAWCQVMVTFTGTWAQKANVPGARHSAVGFSIGNKGYVGLGRDGGTLRQDFWEYDPVTNNWTQKADFPGGVREYAIGFSIGNKGYVGTGLQWWGSRHQDFWEYDPDTDTWTQKANFPGGNRSGAVGFSIGNKGYVGTGDDGNNRHQDFWEYDPASNVWTRRANFGGSVRSWAAGFSIGNRGYLGVGSSSGYSHYQDFWEYDPVSNRWTQKADFQGDVIREYGYYYGYHSSRDWSVGFSIGNKGYIATGCPGSQNYFQDVIEYDPVSNSWIQKADFAGGIRNRAVGFSIGNKGYIGTGNIDGSETTGAGRQDFWEFSP